MTRVLYLLAAIGMAGCDGSPSSLGITGPGPQPPPPGPSSDESDPSLPDTMGPYGPSIGPMQSNQRYFNYN
ncbi:MAG TPA: hypothetical protein VFL55_00925 [Acetobacteraceae bacterium]|jgi:hypothetical protein|nr:hypothetical protein [Acetobacteraceae bacterium]